MTSLNATVGTASHEALNILYQHRLATTGQLRRLLTPDTTNRQYIWRVLDRLRKHRLVESINATEQGRHPHCWFLSSAGADAVEQEGSVPVRRYRMTRDRAAGPLQRHSLAVTEVGVLMFEDARRRGDSFGPLSWIPEVAHRFQQGESAGDANDTHVISDALVHYTRVNPSGSRTQLQSFLELDRATMPVHRLAAKLVSYARYYDHTPLPEPRRRRRAAQGQGVIAPAWTRRYPRFPRILVVLDGARPELQEDRRWDLASFVDNVPYLTEPRHGFDIGCATMHDLATQGPNAPIWSHILSSDPTALTDFQLRKRND
ncbi:MULTISPECIES: replication-relaxation family protein [unclassified Nocardiopsis]|uniref:replication-relaxation family protein n=1 Tax=unclassified Nocardiopsis TaxID=2649073 RepID=UPI00135ABAD0|nr:MULTISPECIES: replication-relaxation family protein [unclassified Nocardiopsis]